MEHFGRYQLIAELGQGGMAQVFLAQLGRGPLAKLLAIKRLLPTYSNTRTVVERLAAEARLTVWLSHPNIVQVFDFGRVGDYYYIAMEYVDGCDMRELMWPRSRSAGVQLPVAMTLEVCLRVLDALHYAHTCTDAAGKPLGIIHRDISPHNVLVSRDGDTKLADFGVARATLFTTHHTHPRAVLGKLTYMAPEQARGQAYDARVDVYATGVMLYEMLTGRKAFPDRLSPAEVGHRLPPGAASIRPELSPQLDALLARAMAPRPEERFASAAAMAEEVARELVAVGGSPDPAILRDLVAEAVKGRAIPLPAGTPLVRTGSISFEEYTPGNDSLIVEEVTSVKQRVRPVAPQSPPPVPRAPELPAARPAPRQVDPQQEALARLKTDLKALPPTAPWSPPVIDDGPSSPPSQPADALPTSSPAAVPLEEPELAADPRLSAALVWALLAGAALTLFGVGVLLGRWTRGAPPPIPAAGSARPPLVRFAPPASRPAKVVRGLQEKVAPADKPSLGARPIVREEDVPTRVKVTDPDDEAVRAVRPATLRKGISDAAWSQAVSLIRDAQSHFAVGSHAQAIDEARRVLQRVPDSLTAWQIIAASECALKHEAGARTAAQHVDAQRRSQLRQVCARHGVDLR